VQGEVHLADSTQSVTVEQVPGACRFNLQEVETYWEFRADSPLQQISDLKAALQNFNELDVATRHYKDAELGNGVCITVPIRAGVDLKVYAKTNRRIRFEVVHDLKECSTPAHILGSSRDPHTFSSLSGVYRKLGLLRQDAAEIMSTVFQHMRQQNTLPTTPKRALHLLYDILQAVADPEIARVLIWTLVSNQRVVSMPPLTPYLKELKRRGILEIQPRNQTRAYVVTPAYRFALEALASNSNFPDLTTRHRSRGC